MKTSHIIILIAGAILLVALGVNLGSEASTYTGFQEAAKTDRTVHIVGQWVQREQADYDQDRDLFRFYLQDENGQAKMVHFRDPKPVNFEQAEKVVIIGSYSHEKDVFEADQIQMKCPSKYEETDVTAAEKKS